MESNTIPYQLIQAFSFFHRQKFSIPPVKGINPGELRILRAIGKSMAVAGVMVSELSERLQVSPSFITQISNGLVKRGLVDRSQDPNDRRAVRLRLTAKGDEAVRDAASVISAHFQGLANALGPEQSKELLRLMNIVNDYLANVRVGKND